MSKLEQERELFEKCLQAPHADRDAPLEAECPNDAQMREHVRRMLRHDVELATEDGDFLRLGKSDPERIGPYRILQRLGEGGMGIVYAGEQREPVRRRVAIKVLRVGHNSGEVLARFDAERQALSLMSHIHVARILDAGTTVDHRPYIVMEYVPGEPITRYCNSRSLSLQERLQLFRDVCEAVQHAHQKGVIHRDLKPSNILVMEENGRAVPKVIDFGIAKAITQRLTDHALETKVGSLLGTPDYMSPEQAELTPLDVDTRADVYALGAVLYHVLTGAPPLELGESGKSYSEIQRVIREQEPVAPSLKARDESIRIARELDWITLKALEKDRNRRYVTAAALGDDIARFLAGEAPEAGPQTIRYKAAKFVQRHMLGVGVVAGTFLLILTFAVMMAWQVQQTALERDRANREAEIARHVTGFTASLFALANPQESGVQDVTARALLDAGTKRLEAQTTDERAEVRAALFEAASEAYHGLGVHEQAERLAEKALALYREQSQTDPVSFAKALINLAHMKREHGEIEAAATLGKEAMAVAKESVDRALLLRAEVDYADTLRSGSSFEAAVERLESVLSNRSRELPPAAYSPALSLLGRIWVAQGRFDEAESVLKQVVKLESAADGSLSLDGEQAKGGLAYLYSDVGRFEEAIGMRRELLAAKRQRYGETHLETAKAWNNLAFALLDIPDRYQEAEQALLASLGISRQVVGEQHPSVLRTLSNLAWLYGYTGRWQQAHDTYKEVINVREQLLGADHIDTANARHGLGRTLIELGKPAEAEHIIRQSLTATISHLGAAHWRVGATRRSLGLALIQQAQYEQGISELNRSYEILLAALGPAHRETVKARTSLDEALEQTAAR